MNVPKLRFKDNNGNDYPQWEKKKLGDTLLIQRGGSPRPISDYITNDKNGLNWIKIGDCPSNSNIITSTKEKIKPEGLSKTREVFVGDLILSNSMSFGRPYILNINGCIHDGWLLLRDTQKIYNLQFLCYILGSEYITKQYKKLASGSTVNNLNKDLVGSVIINIPQLEEQTKIVNFLSTVDKKISNIENIITNLEKQKKGLLQQIFSQKLRFKDENDKNNYTSYHLHNLIKDIKSGNNKERTDTGTYPVYGSMGILGYNNNYVYNFTSLLIARVGINAGKVSLVTGKYDVSDNTLIIIPSNKVNIYYLYYYLINFNLNKLVFGSGQPLIKASELKKIIIQAPCLEEQTKIADFLSAFDRKIDNQKAQLEHWKQIKKGLLQQMFV